MAPINTKNVHRTNALRGHPWGRDFLYDERMLTGDGAKGRRRAHALARTARVQNALLAFAPTRALLRRFALPKPGEGPSKSERETGRFEVLLIGRTALGQTVRGSVKGDRTTDGLAACMEPAVWREAFGPVVDLEAAAVNSDFFGGHYSSMLRQDESFAREKKFVNVSHSSACL
jgi:short subunit dehydrogenase-like uncharacterized protein